MLLLSGHTKGGNGRADKRQKRTLGDYVSPGRESRLKNINVNLTRLTHSTRLDANANHWEEEYVCTRLGLDTKPNTDIHCVCTLFNSSPPSSLFFSLYYRQGSHVRLVQTASLRPVGQPVHPSLALSLSLTPSLPRFFPPSCILSLPRCFPSYVLPSHQYGPVCCPVAFPEGVSRRRALDIRASSRGLGVGTSACFVRISRALLVKLLLRELDDLHRLIAPWSAL